MPNDANVSTDLGVAYYYTNQPDRALAQFDQSLSIDPKHVKTLLNIGIVRAFGKQDLAGAGKAWQQVVDLAPDSPEGLAAKKGLEGIQSAQGTAERSRPWRAFSCCSSCSSSSPERSGDSSMRVRARRCPAPAPQGGRRPGAPAAVKMSQCPVCGTYVVPGKAISLVSGGSPIYFDSEKCRAEYQSR